jgi:hypothetical protein
MNLLEEAKLGKLKKIKMTILSHVLKKDFCIGLLNLRSRGIDIVSVY